jgi:predicted transcriptional regulator YheO
MAEVKTQVQKDLEIKREDLCMKEYVFLIVRHHMERHNGNISLVSSNLCLSRKTIYNYLKEMEAIGI